MRLAFFGFALLGLVACTETTPTSTQMAALDGFSVQAVPNTSTSLVQRLDADGLTVLEEGQMRDGKKTGTWVTYHPGGTFPATLTTYVNGQRNGVYLEFNERGFLILREGYKNDQLHGRKGEFSFGRPEMEAHYQGGQLHGAYREYSKNNGRLQKEINYRNGQKHGAYRFYNEAGEVTVEYEYANDEKVSGGIVE